MDIEIFEFTAKMNKYCVCIIEVQEGDKLKSQLKRMAYLSQFVDIVIADGGSTDGSIEHSFLKQCNVNTLLVKKHARQGATMRMAFAWALERGYPGVIVIDGNNKDSVDDIPKFIEELDKGVDHISGSRFIKGGKHVNTPVLRLIGVKLIYMPLINIAAGFRYTDVTNGFKAYSARLLKDKNIAVFRDVLDGYELHDYLSIRAARLKFKISEVPVTRIYPDKGIIPSKVRSFRMYMHVLWTLIKTVSGKYNP
jgi:dolichol-phosphate mannosyltransferase